MDGCLDENTVLAFLAGKTPDGDRAGIEHHLKTCSACTELVTWAAAELMHESRAPGQEGRPFIGALAPGTQVARYQILNAVGRGGMGGVYAAYHPDLDRRVALKVVHESRADSATRQARLLREARAIARLSHPNVITVYDAGTFDDRVYIAMEFVEGQTVDAWLRAEPRGWREILRVFVAAGRGLAAAHAAGVIHRDFKPHNVMIGSDGSVRVMDFGLARLSEAEEALVASGAQPAPLATKVTQTSAVIGTPAYMSPEQFLREPIDARSDQFSFCVALYQALDGAHPFGGGTFDALMASVTAGRLQAPSPKSAVPPWLRRILLRGLSVAPSQRWDSMEALIAALSHDPAQRRRRVVAVSAAIVAMVAVGATLRMSRHEESICRGGPARAAEAWDIEAGAEANHANRAATRDAFGKTGLSHAATVWEHTANLLDRYVGDWLHMYRDACEATHVRGEQSVAVLDLRMACLTDRLQHVKALTNVFTNANATVVDNAIQAASALPALDRCADVRALRAAVSPPEDPKARARVSVLKDEVARVKALGDSGQCAAAAAAGHAVIAEAKAVSYPPLEGEVLVELGRWGSACVDSAEMLRMSKRAALIGLASHDAEMAAKGAMFLGTILADRTPDIAQAREWLDVAEALLLGISRPHPILEGWRLEAMARVYSQEGDAVRALDAIQRARPLLEVAYGRDHPDIALLLSNTGLILVSSGRLEEAVRSYEQAAEMATRLAGPDHPTVGLAVGNAAEALNTLGRYEEARVAAERALAIWRRAGSSAIYEATALNSLGQALLGLGRPSDAVENLERARSLLGDDRSLYPHEIRFALARALWTWPEKRGRALALAREARAGYQGAGTAAAEVAAVDTWLHSHRN